MSWIESLQGVTDEQKAFLTENNIDSSEKLLGYATAKKGSTWLDELSPDQKGYVELKKFDKPGVLLDSYKNLETMIGVPKERVLKLPEKAEDQAGWDAVYNRLGRPETPDGYTIPDSEDEATAKWAKETFHKLGLTKAQGEKFIAYFNDRVSAEHAARQAKAEADAKNEDLELRVNWGRAYEKNVNKALGVLKGGQFGIKTEHLDGLKSVLGHTGTFQFLNAIAEKIGEANFHGGNPPGNAMTPHAAKAKLAELKSDSGWLNKLAAGDVEAVSEMNKLVEMTHAGDFERMS